MSEHAIEITDLSFRYDQTGPLILRDVSLSVPHGQFLALVGANGSGKTTLARHLNGLLRPDQGQVRVAGQDTTSQPIGRLAQQVGYLFQHPEQQIFGETVHQEVAFGPQNLGYSPAEIESRVKSALARLDLEAFVDRPPAILSYGLRRRVTLASLAAMDPPILVLDEPTVGLDAPSRIETLEWLTELHALGRTILLITHDMTLVAEYAERVVVLNQGQIVADGIPAKIFQQESILAQFSLDLPPVLALARALQPNGMRGDSLTVQAFCDEYVALVTKR